MSTATAALAGAAAPAATTATPAAATTTTQTGVAGTVAAGAATTTANDEYAYAKDWSPELRDLVTKKAWKSPDMAALSYAQAEKLLGAPADQIVRLPKEGDATARREALSKFGVPAKVEDYKIEGITGADPEFLKTATGWMHEIGIPMREGQELAKKWAAFGDAQLKAQDTAMAATITKDTGELMAEWGDRANANRVAVKEAQKAMGLADADVDAMAKTLGVKKTFGLLAKIGTPLLPAEFHGGANQGGGGAFNALTPQEATTKRSELMSDGAWVKRWSDGDRAAVTEMQQLDNIIAGERARLAGSR